MSGRLSNDQDRLDILILFCSQKVPDSFYGIHGFQFHRKDRVGKSSGGILAYVNNSLKTKRRGDLEANEFEILWFEICPHKSKRPLVVDGIYRPPSYRSEDDKKLGKNIENVYLLNKEIFLLGDFNIDHSCKKKFGKQPFIKTLHNMNLSQIVKVITRPLSKTCLDHIWSSHPERLINVRVFPSGLSDHLPTIVTRKYKPVIQSTVAHTTITYRDI